MPRKATFFYCFGTMCSSLLTFRYFFLLWATGTRSKMRGRAVGEGSCPGNATTYQGGSRRSLFAPVLSINKGRTRDPNKSTSARPAAIPFTLTGCLLHKLIMEKCATADIDAPRSSFFFKQNRRNPRERMSALTPDAMAKPRPLELSLRTQEISTFTSKTCRQKNSYRKSSSYCCQEGKTWHVT